jgi:hypothetical protein
VVILKTTIAGEATSERIITTTMAETREEKYRRTMAGSCKGLEGLVEQTIIQIMVMSIEIAEERRHRVQYPVNVRRGFIIRRQIQMVIPEMCQAIQTTVTTETTVSAGQVAQMAGLATARFRQSKPAHLRPRILVTVMAGMNKRQELRGIVMTTRLEAGCHHKHLSRVTVIRKRISIPRDQA